MVLHGSSFSRSADSVALSLNPFTYPQIQHHLLVLIFRGLHNLAPPNSRISSLAMLLTGACAHPTPAPLCLSLQPLMLPECCRKRPLLLPSLHRPAKSGPEKAHSTYVSGCNSGRSYDVAVSIQDIDSLFQLCVSHQDHVANIGTGCGEGDTHKGQSEREQQEPDLKS